MIMNALRRLFGMRPPGGIGCEEAMRQLQEYMDGELDTLTHQEVEAHLELCQRCFPHLNLERRFRARITRAMERGDCPEHVRDRVLETIAGGTA